MMKKFKETIYFNREKEDNWDIEDKAQELGFKNSENIRYLGSEVEMEIEVREDLNYKVLFINGVDVSDKDIYI